MPLSDFTQDANKKRPESPTYRAMMSGREQGLRDIAARHYNEINSLRKRFTDNILPRYDKSIEQFNSRDWTYHLLTIQEKETYEALMESLDTKHHEIIQNNSEIERLINSQTKDLTHLTSEERSISQLRESLNDFNQILEQIDHLQKILQASIDKIEKSDDSVKESYKRFKESVEAVNANIDKFFASTYYQTINTFNIFCREAGNINPSGIFRHLENLEKSMIYKVNPDWYDKIEKFHQNLVVSPLNVHRSWNKCCLQKLSDSPNVISEPSCHSWGTLLPTGLF